MKKIITSLLTLTLTLGAWAQTKAYDFRVDKYFYKITNADTKEVTVSRELTTNSVLTQTYYEAGNAPTGDVVVPATVTYGDVEYAVTGVGEAFLYNLAGVTSVTLPETIKRINSAAFAALQIKTLELPVGIDYIGEQVFMSSQLTEIVIPEGVDSIGQMAFVGISTLQKVVLPSTLKFLGNYAFGNSTKLTQIDLAQADTAALSIGASLFYGVTPANITLTVPAGSGDAYKAAAQWKDLNVVEKGTSGIAAAAGATTLVDVTAAGIAISLDKAAEVAVYRVNGAVTSPAQTLAAGRHTLDLGKGVYIVKVGSQSVKVVL